MRFLLANTSSEEIHEIPAVEIGPVSLEFVKVSLLISSLIDIFSMSCLGWRVMLSPIMTFSHLIKVSRRTCAPLTTVLNSTTTFLSSILSSFYFDAIKETVYCETANDTKRVAIIAVLQRVSAGLDIADLRLYIPLAR